LFDYNLGENLNRMIVAHLNPDIKWFPDPPRINIPNEKIPALYEFLIC
jgi:hypothetical protein